MLEKIKLLLGITGTEKDALLGCLIEEAITFATTYCNIKNLPAYLVNLESIIIKMVLEDYNRLGNEGMSAQSFNGISETYNQDYSPQLYKLLNKHKRIKMI